MMTIFGIVLFLPFFDAMITKKFLVTKSQKVKALMLGFATIITAIMVGDLSWFLMRQLPPLDSDAQGGSLMQSTDWMAAGGTFPMPGGWDLTHWYILVIAIAYVCYYLSFKRN
jgi:hypothetical protein